MSFTRSPFRDRNNRVVEQRPNDFYFNDYRYIVNETTWENKIISFPLEINCQSGANVHIDNCEFKDLLIIRLNDGISIEGVFIFCSEMAKSLKLFGTEHRGNKIVEDISIDSCTSNKVEIIQLDCKKIEIYKTKICEIVLEASKAQELGMDRSDIGILLEHSTSIATINIHENTFSNEGIIPKKLFGILEKRYQNKEDAKDSSLRTIDFLLKNTNVTLNSHISSALFYERNRIQTSSIFSRMILWSFGYFQSPARYLTTAIIAYFFTCLLLGASFVSSGTFLPLKEVFVLAFNGLFGLSFTLSDNSNYISRFLVSLSIGVGTVFYSGLLVTLINRFRIRF